MSPRSRAQKTLELLDLGCHDPYPWQVEHAQSSAVRTDAQVTVTADIRDVSDIMLVDHFNAIAEMYKAVAGLGRELRRYGISIPDAELNALQGDTLGWTDEASRVAGADHGLRGTSSTKAG